MFDNFTLDIDYSVMTRFSEQEGAKKDIIQVKKAEQVTTLLCIYRRHKTSCQYLVTKRNTYSSNNFLAFLEDTLSKHKNKTIGLIRLDSGFFQSDILAYLEEKAMDYVGAVKFTNTIQSLVQSSANRVVLDTVIKICEQKHQSE
jgi:hypothetical protein